MFLHKIRSCSSRFTVYGGASFTVGRNVAFFSYVLTALLFTAVGSSGQQIKRLHSGSGIVLRGLSAVSDEVIWVSGNKGTIGKTADGGENWEWMVVPGFEDRDFRDIEAFDRETAVIMAVGEPAVILKTVDAGKRWKVVYRNETPGMFLDAMEFWNGQSGIVVGDPIGGRFFIARSFDGGSNWRAMPAELLPMAESGEACFAASGTNLRALARDEACFISGGRYSRFFWKKNPVTLPVVQGKESTGANSIAVWMRGRRASKLVVVGGDFYKDSERAGNCVISHDGGRSWMVPQVAPGGYRSCVEFFGKKKLVTCGVNGVDVSDDAGRTWKKISDTGYHVCRKTKTGRKVFLAGADGRVGVMEREQ